MSVRAQQGVQRWVREEVRALSAYHVPEADGAIKLDAMENPYSWPEEMVDEWLERLRHVTLNRYPDPAARSLTPALRAALAVPDGAQLLLGNGSDELIQLLCLAVGGPGRTLLTPEPGFSMYAMIARFTGTAYHGVPLKADFSLDGPGMLAAISEHQPALVFIAWPNNPTGNLFDAQTLREILRAAPGLVVIDEAYTAFAGESFLPELAQWPNLLVMRTLSKVGLAGLRLGLLAGAPAWLEQLDKLRLPYNVNVLTQVSATFALAHADVLEAQARRIVRDREALQRELQRREGFEVFPSSANFLLARVPAGRAGEFHAGLRERGVLVKCLHGAHPMLGDCLRITVGTAAENRALLAALDQMLAPE